MTPKRRAAINLSWFFYMPLLQQISTDQKFPLQMNGENVFHHSIIVIVSPSSNRFLELNHASFETVILLVYVIGLHAVQFGNNWIRKILRTAKIGRGRRPSPIWQSEEFFESNYFQIGQACSPVT